MSYSSLFPTKTFKINHIRTWKCARIDLTPFKPFNEQNSKKTTRRATTAIWGIFAELDKPKTYTIEDNLNIDAGKLVLAMFLN